MEIKFIDEEGNERTYVVDDVLGAFIEDLIEGYNLIHLN